MSSASAHAWHHIHFLGRLTEGGDATKHDRTGPWALHRNGANHLSPHRQTLAPQMLAPPMPEWPFFCLHWCPEAGPGDAAPTWGLNLRNEGGANESCKESLLWHQPAVERSGLKLSSIYDNHVERKRLVPLVTWLGFGEWQRTTRPGRSRQSINWVNKVQSAEGMELWWRSATGHIFTLGQSLQRERSMLPCWDGRPLSPNTT